MRYRKLGQSGVKVSEISLGCWTMGGLNWVGGQPNGWADVDESEIAAAIDHALDQGVNHFDNADVYGNGRAERMLARILGRRSQHLLIASKVGHFPGTAEHAYEPVHIQHQCEQSLLNLKRDVIDIYYFHHGDFGPDDRYLDDALQAMHRLREAGKIRLIGLSAYSTEDFVRLIPKIEPDVVQSWASTLDTRFIDPEAPVRKLLEQRKISFVAFGPLGQGRLLGKYSPAALPRFEAGDHRRDNQAFSAEALRELSARIERLKSRFGSGVEQLARVALQYVLAYPCVACVIPGFRNLRQVAVNLRGKDAPLSDDELSFVREVMR